MKTLYRTIPLLMLVIFMNGKVLAQESDDEITSAEDYVLQGLEDGLHGDFEQAVENFDMAIKVDSAYAEAYLWRGIFSDDADYYDLALELYTEILEDAPDDADALLGIGLVYNVLGETNDQNRSMRDAIRAYDTLIDNDPENGIAYFNRGFANRMLGNYEQAITDYESALEIDPTFEERLRLYSFYAQMYALRASDLYREVNMGDFADEYCDGVLAGCTSSDWAILFRQYRPALSHYCSYAEIMGEYANSTFIEAKESLEDFIGEDCRSVN